MKRINVSDVYMYIILPYQNSTLKNKKLLVEDVITQVQVDASCHNFVHTFFR